MRTKARRALDCGLTSHWELRYGITKYATYFRRGNWYDRGQLLSASRTFLIVKMQAGETGSTGMPAQHGCVERPFRKRYSSRNSSNLRRSTRFTDPFGLSVILRIRRHRPAPAGSATRGSCSPIRPGPHNALRGYRLRRLAQSQ